MCHIPIFTSVSPENFALEMGWDFTQIEDTARRGVSEADQELLTESEATALRAWCKARTGN